MLTDDNCVPVHERAHVYGRVEPEETVTSLVPEWIGQDREMEEGGDCEQSGGSVEIVGLRCICCRLGGKRNSLFSDCSCDSEQTGFG